MGRLRWLLAIAIDSESHFRIFKGSSIQADGSAGLALVLGAEGTGLRDLTRKTCDYLVRLPQLGSVESLNVSVATGMLLYEAVRQRLKP